MSAVRVLFAGMAGLLLLAAPMDEAQAQSAPQVKQVWRSGTTLSSATYGLDHVSQISVEFDQSVEVTGTPMLVVEIGSQKRNLDPYAGYGFPMNHYVGPLRLSSPILSYEYYVQASEAGSVVATGFDLNGGTITSAETGEAADLVFERTEVIPSVDGRDRLDSPLTDSRCFLRPFNSWPSLPRNANSRVIGEIQIAALCIEALTVTGTPQVPLIVGSRTRYANYIPALSVASQPIFSYTLQEADVGNGCIRYRAPWRMNGGSIVLRGHKPRRTSL